MKFALIHPHAQTTAATPYHSGTKAVFDTVFAGLVPVRVVEVVEQGFGWQVAPSGKVRAQVIEDHQAYRKGEVLTLSSADCVPVAQLNNTQFRTRVNTNYLWKKDEA